MDTPRQSDPIASFVAVLPDVAAALRISGGGDGRLQLDVPMSELPEVLKLMAFGRGKRRLHVSIEAD
jgi:hypothetical protein